MDGVPLSLIFSLFGLIVLSAFFSSAETAFATASRIRLRNYADEGRRGGRQALYIADNYDNALSTILIGNTIANIAAASIFAKMSFDLFGAGTGLLVSTIGMTALILLFGEILPKAVAREHAERYALVVSRVLLPIIRALTPVNYLLGLVRRIVARPGGTAEPSMTEEEIKAMIDISEEEGVIDKEEKELVRRSLAFNDITVGEVLTPRPDMVAVEIDQPAEEIMQVFIRERYSRIPVYEKNIDHIVGILSEREFYAELLKYQKVKIRKLLRKPLFVTKSRKIASLLHELQRSNVHMSIVVDEFGGTSGLITLEDIIEELVGEIWDEHDEKISVVTRRDEKSYELDAQMPLDEFAELFGLAPLASAYHNLGGWIIERLERIPEAGDAFDYEHITLTVAEVEKRRVRKVRAVVNTADAGAQPG